MAPKPLKSSAGGAARPEAPFGLVWPGKAEAAAQAESPCRARVQDLGGEASLLIDGDNLDALKLLQTPHAGRIKLIYIDPPYNTGAEALYPDDFAAPKERRRRPRDAADDRGRLHAAWLNMIYPRLILARRLLRDDGVIFISIDAAELANLILVCDEVFGEANRIEIFSWVRTTTPAALAGKTKKVVEYLLCYERRRSGQVYRGVEKPVRSANALLNQANPPGELVFPPGSVTTALPDGIVRAGAYGSRAYDVQLLEDARVQGGRFVSPLRLRGRFRWRQAYLEAQLAAGVVVHIATARLIPAYAKARYGREALPNLIDARVGVGGNETATAELRGLLGDGFADLARRMRPKPVSLLTYLIEAVCGPDDWVLDFFAGSGVTGQAVLEGNARAGSHRRFILVQSPEPTGRPDCPTIAEIARRRLAATVVRLGEPGAAQAGAYGLVKLEPAPEAPNPRTKTTSRR